MGILGGFLERTDRNRQVAQNQPNSGIKSAGFASLVIVATTRRWGERERRLALAFSSEQRRRRCGRDRKRRVRAARGRHQMADAEECGDPVTRAAGKAGHVGGSGSERDEEMETRRRFPSCRPAEGRLKRERPWRSGASTIRGNAFGPPPEDVGGLEAAPNPPSLGRLADPHPASRLPALPFRHFRNLGDVLFSLLR